jgi:methylated-DNA-[protein]-cysteine S-methyltransferase
MTQSHHGHEIVTDPTFTLERLRTKIGTLLLLTDARGRLRALDWEDHEPRMRRLLRAQYGCDIKTVKAVKASAARRALERYFAGDVRALDRLRTQTLGTPFQRRVWAALREIPVGKTVTYGALAKRLGCPSASRAVGAANGANPIPIVVPCHRVIGAGGALTGYGGGIERKRWLLRHEGAL